MATKDVAVYDGSDWVSISGADGPAGADGKSVEFNPPGTATNVANINDTTPGLATLTLTLNGGASDATKNVYDVSVGVPIGIKGDKGDDGTGVNILGEKDDVGDLPDTGNPGDGWLINGDLWVWDNDNGQWIDAGSIQGPAGDPGLPPTFTENVATTEKACGDYTTTVTVTPDGGTTEQPNYKLAMQLPRPVKVYSATDNGGSPNGITGACAGDFWLVQE